LSLPTAPLTLSCTPLLTNPVDDPAGLLCSCLAKPTLVETDRFPDLGRQTSNPSPNHKADAHLERPSLREGGGIPRHASTAVQGPMSKVGLFTGAAGPAVAVVVGV